MQVSTTVNERHYHFITISLPCIEYLRGLSRDQVPAHCSNAFNTYLRLSSCTKPLGSYPAAVLHIGWLRSICVKRKFTAARVNNYVLCLSKLTQQRLAVLFESDNLNERDSTIPIYLSAQLSPRCG